MKSVGRIGELKYDSDRVLPLKPSEYFKRNCWVGVSFPSPGEAADGKPSAWIGSCGAATTPTTNRLIRTPGKGSAGPLLAHPEDELQQILGGNARRSTGSTWLGSARWRKGSDRLSKSSRNPSRESPRATVRRPSRGRMRAPSAAGSKRLAGRRALVTGASRGIGAATAQRLAAEGAESPSTARTAEHHPTLSGSLRETTEQIERTRGQGGRGSGGSDRSGRAGNDRPRAEEGLGGPIDIWSTTLRRPSTSH